MKLVRNIIGSFQSMKDGIDPFESETTLNDGRSLSLKTLSVWDEEKPVDILFSANVALQSQPEKSDGGIKIPDEPRNRLEGFIEFTASTISLAHSTKRKLYSIVPEVALIPETDEDEKILDDSSGFAEIEQGNTYPEINPDLNFDEDLYTKLMDRPDGVRILADALTHENATGALIDYIRLFERAFEKNSSDLVDVLSEFIDGSDFEFDRSSIERYIRDTRNRAVHADASYRDEYYLESDIRPIIGRVKQIAYDVLLNKENWRSDDVERRDLWEPDSYIPDSDGQSTRISYDANSTVSVQINQLDTYDRFGSYPVHPEGLLTDMPDEWWSPFSEY